MQRAPFIPLSAYSTFVPPRRPSPPQLAGFYWPPLQHPWTLSVPICMNFLANPSITVTEKVFFLVFVSMMLACQVWASVYFVYGFPLFLSIPFGKPTPSDNLTGINITTFHITLSISLVDQVWVSSLPPLLSVSQVFLSACSCLCVLPFLNLFLHWKGPWADILKGTDAPSFHRPFWSRACPDQWLLQRPVCSSVLLLPAVSINLLQSLFPTLAQSLPDFYPWSEDGKC